MGALKGAFGLLSRIPVGCCDGEDVSHGVLWYPLVGAVIGGVSAGLCALFSGQWVLAGLFALLAELLLTGALHADGLADVCDALLCHADAARRHQALKDSRLGTGGVLGLLFDCALQVTLVALLVQERPHAAWRYVLAAGIAHRSAMALALGLGRPAKKEGLGSGVMQHLRAWRVLGALSMGVLAMAALLYVDGFALAAAAPALALGMGALCTLLLSRAFGGMSGDLVGAAGELTRLCVLGLFALAVLP
nr:adenosylcobinamide-GDP ribazoletransferase [Maliibacterium massiliense]